LQVLVDKRSARAVARLQAADGALPINPVVALLGDAIGLDAIELRVLDFLDLHLLSEPLRVLLRTSERASERVNRSRLAAALDVREPTLRAVLSNSAALRTLGLVHLMDESDLEDYVRPSDLLRTLLDAGPQDVDGLLALLIEPAPAAAWQLADFPHLAAPANRLSTAMVQATRTGEVGVNALFYGAPGTGKTELARTLAAAQGLRAYQVRSSDDDNDGLSRRGRLSAYLLAQRLLARRRDAVLIFDEIEDVFEGADDLMWLLGGRGRRGGQQKGWMNRILEDNPVPAIWITNDTDGMDPAFLRRFLLPVAFSTPPRSVRRQMAERHLGDCGLPPLLLDELAADAALTPAQLGAARRLLELSHDSAPELAVRDGVAAMRTLLHGAPAPRRRAMATAFDVAFLNLAGEITPSAIVQALDRRGSGSLCFYGPPGTGKTAFAEVLAEALDRELVARQASDLISPYVGETEQNLARLFRDADPATTVLLLDEVDSFLSERTQARHSWERTQVNELLQQMERYPGIFVAATNLMSGIDTAALRRFDFKLHFRALTPAQRLRLFAREALGDDQAEVPDLIARHLHSLDTLTPGDFATVCRQRALLGEEPTPEQFLRRLVMECRMKQGEGQRAA
jgi:SpoVK/Ycf46/Vps4 family AAA+-type ATPase